MKVKTNYILLLLILCFGCDHWVEGYDDDPNSTPEASIDNLLTASQVNIFNFSENHLARTISIWMQQMAGTDRQYKSLGLYSFEENDYSASWQSVYINGGLKDLREIQRMANDLGVKGNRYKAMSQFMEAYLIGMAASVWGNIAYSEVLNESIDNPILDDQESVYLKVQSLLDSVIINLESDTTLIPINDMFYNGDIEKWRKAAYSLKARYYMHWVELDEYNCEAAITNAKKGISSLDGTLQSLHGTQSSEENMWYQFSEDRAGYMVAGANLINLLNSNNDPRLNIYFEENDAGSIVGAGINGTAQGKSYLNSEYFGKAAAIEILSFEENLLIQSECYYLLNNEIEAKEMLDSARIAAEEKWGFEYGSLALPSLFGTALFNKIKEEKYISLFLNIELWNDYKRNCYPDVKYKKSEDDDGNPIYEFPPGRIYYPEDERITNINIPIINDQPLYNDNDINGCEY